MAEYYAVRRSADYLMHSGVKGMKWGIRKERIRNGVPHSKAYDNAKRKLQKATMVGGIAGGLAYAATHRNDFKAINNGNKSSIKRTDIKVKQRKPVTLSSKEKEFVSGMNKAGRISGLVGGVGGSAVGTLKYMHDHPKEYASYKKKFKQASFKDRMKMLYG